MNSPDRHRINDPFGGALPHNIEAEECLLGAILNNNDAFGRIERIVRAEDCLSRSIGRFTRYAKL
jgi:replicative DNA helicase